MNNDIGSLRKGSEVRIVDQDTSRNTITVVDKHGGFHEIQVRQHGNSLSQFSERETEFSIGEKVIWTKNDNSDYGRANSLKNGITGIIEDIRDGVAIIRTESGYVIQQQMDGAFITNGQAITIDKSQGATADHVITLMPGDAPSELLNENKAYVALTRMTKEVEIITDNKNQLLQAVSGSQEKSSTLEENQQLLSELKDQIEAQRAESNSRSEVNFLGSENYQNEQVADQQQAQVQIEEASLHDDQQQYQEAGLES